MPRNLLKRLLMRSFLPLWRSRTRRAITILMLHGVMDASTAPSSWAPLRHHLPPARLDAALAVLSRWYRFVSLDRAVAMLEGRERTEPHCMVLTFDDGYRNNLTHAQPILEKHGAPLTMFLATGHVTRREPFWYDRMDFVLQRLPGPMPVAWGDWRASMDPADREGLRRGFAEFRHVWKGGREPYAEKTRRLEGLLSELESAAGSRLLDVFEEDPWTSLVGWDEVRKFSAAGVTFGSHTVDHVLLDSLDDSAMRRQLTMSARELAAHTGKSCELLCYPNGNWSPRVVEVAQECGYRAGLTTQAGVNRQGRANLLVLNRNGLPAANDELSILAAASGMTSFLGRRRSPKEA